VLGILYHRAQFGEARISPAACLCMWAGVEGAKKFRHQSLQWHEGCFKCTECTASIGASSFIPHNGQPVCVKCYHDKYAFKCHKCHQVSSSIDFLYFFPLYGFWATRL